MDDDVEHEEEEFNVEQCDTSHTDGVSAADEFVSVQVSLLRDRIVCSLDDELHSFLQFIQDLSELKFDPPSTSAAGDSSTAVPVSHAKKASDPQLLSSSIDDLTDDLLCMSISILLSIPNTS